LPWSGSWWKPLLRLHCLVTDIGTESREWHPAFLFTPIVEYDRFTDIKRSSLFSAAYKTKFDRYDNFLCRYDIEYRLDRLWLMEEGTLLSTYLAVTRWTLPATGCSNGYRLPTALWRKNNNLNLNPRLKRNVWHMRLIPQQIKKYALDLQVKPGFFETTVNSIAHAIHSRLSLGFRLHTRGAVRWGF